MVPTELPNANSTSQTDMSVQENLLRYYEQNLAELPEDQKLTKLCSDAGFLKDNGKGQCFIALEEEEGPEDMQTIMSRVHITSRSGSIPSERVDSWKHEDRPSLGCEGLQDVIVLY